MTHNKYQIKSVDYLEYWILGIYGFLTSLKNRTIFMPIYDMSGDRRLLSHFSQK